MSLAPGATVGAYRIVKEIGRGGMAVVYKAYQAGLDRDVAIKVLPDFLAEDAGFQQRFQQEALAVARLRHPHILTIYDYHAEPGAAYLVMEYIDGGTLADRVGKPLDPAAVVALLAPIASALDYAHARGVLHRDVKPSNILLSSDGFPFLADFGIAKLMASSERMTRTGTLIGTPEYMAPEQATGAPPGPSIDTYALAVVAYELLTGVVPFNGDTPAAILTAHMDRPLPPPRSLNPALVPGIEAALAKALAKQPSDRYPTATAFMTALAAAADLPPPRLMLGPAAAPPAAPPDAAPTGIPMPADKTAAIVAANDRTAAIVAANDRTAAIVAANDRTAAIVAASVAVSGPTTAPAPALAPPVGHPATVPVAAAPPLASRAHAAAPTADGGTLRFDPAPPVLTAAPAPSRADAPPVATAVADDSPADDRTRLAAAPPAVDASAEDTPNVTRIAGAAPDGATRVALPGEGLTRLAPEPPAEPTRMATPPRAASAAPARSAAPAPLVGRGWRTAAVAFAVALVVAAAFGGTLASRRPAAPRPPTTAPAGPASTLTGTISERTTLASAAPTSATVRGGGSAAPTAVAATATPLPPLTVAPGAVLVSDPLTNAANGTLPKQSGQPAAYTVGYTADGYAIHTVDATQAPPIIAVPGQYANVAIEVQARLVGDAANRFIAVGCRQNGPSFYRLLVAVATGQYLVDEANNGTLRTLNAWRASDAIHTGQATNTFAIRCAGATIEASVNGRQLAAVQGASLRSGQVWIGVGAFPGYAAPTEARFTNLKVTQQ